MTGRLAFPAATPPPGAIREMCLAAACDPDAPAVVCREISGGEAHRACLRRADGDFVWVESPSRGPAALDGARRRTAAVAALLRGRRLAARPAVPTVVDPAYVVYPRVASTLLLSDVLGAPLMRRAAGASPEAASMPVATIARLFRRLGAFLRELHAVPIAGTGPDGLPHDSPAVDAVRALLAAPPAALPAHAVAVRAALRSFPWLTHTATRACDEFAAASRVLVHGSFSLGVIAVSGTSDDTSDQAPAVLDWLAAGRGPAALDHGWIVGELLELGALAAHAAPELGEAILRAAEALFEGYRTAPPAADGSRVSWEDAAPYAALRLLHHQLQNTALLGPDARRIAVLFAGVDRLIPAWAGRLTRPAGRGAARPPDESSPRARGLSA